MSHVTPILPGHASQARRALGMLVIAVAVVASLLTAALPGRSPAAAEDQQAGVAPAAGLAPAAGPGTSVPDASVVFAGRDLPVEEPAPTF
jgi:hypothetical protein